MAKHPSDLLHGTLDVLVLKSLAIGPAHGYAVSRWIEHRTDGLLAFLFAAQMLVYVTSLGHVAMPRGAIALSSVVAAAACLAKGPGGLLASAAVAAHLVATGRGRRAWLSAGVPALGGLAALAAWFMAANESRADVYHVMVENELARHMTDGGWPNPLYYLIHTPTRLGPWIVLIGPAVWFAIRAVAGRRNRPVAPLISLSGAWVAVVFAAFSFLPHQRPDLIYPAQAAVLLLVATLVDRRFPRWAAPVVGMTLVIAAAAFLTPLGAVLVHARTVSFIAPAAAATLAAGAGVTFALARRSPAAACFAGLASIGLVDCLIDTIGNGPRVERVSTEKFGALVRREAELRHATVVAVGLDKPASLFHLRITALALPADLARIDRPILIVTATRDRGDVEDAVGPCEALAAHNVQRGARPPIVLLAPRSGPAAER